MYNNGKIGRERNSERKVSCCQKTYKKIWDVHIDNKVVSKLLEIKTNSKFDKAIRSLVLIMSKMSGYVKTFKIEKRINKLMFFHWDDEKWIEKYKAIWTKIEDLKILN